MLVYIGNEAIKIHCDLRRHCPVYKSVTILKALMFQKFNKLYTESFRRCYVCCCYFVVVYCCFVGFFFFFFFFLGGGGGGLLVVFFHKRMPFNYGFI